MILMPSIDLEAGRAVKRVRGVKNTGLKLGDPVAIAQRFAEEGFRWVHVVDLDGAEKGSPSDENLKVVEKISRELGLSIQFGGGIRSLAAAEKALRAGARRVIVGSLWVKDFNKFVEVVEHVGRSVLAAIEFRGRNELVYNAWRSGIETSLTSVLERLEEVDLLGYLLTQVGVEGTLTGPDLEMVKTLRSLSNRYIVYSGGVSSTKEIIELERAGVNAVVVGMALYRGVLRLRDLARWGR